jgi:hypothetical protein
VRGGAVAKKKPKKEPEREDRITMEIVVDCYNREECAMGWYYYIERQLQLPFTATCIAKRAVSPLRVKDEVEVIGMPPESECESEVFVTIRWEKDGLAVPLAQLQPIADTDEQTKEAVADWHYWLSMGYEYG